jgi:hypothetical protein
VTYRRRDSPLSTPAHDKDENGRGVTLERQSEGGGLEQCEVYLAPAVHALTAIANDALPVGHAGKLTRADVSALREYSKRLGSMATANCERIAMAIESLLPPETADRVSPR